MKLLLTVIFSFAPLLGNALESRVLLVNATVTDLLTEGCIGEGKQDILPSQSKMVAICELRWLRFGQEAMRYNLGPIKTLAARSSKPLVLQASPDGWLYILPAGSHEPTAKPPPQPRGFPLKPNKTVDLT